MDKTFSRILAELQYPPVFMISPEQFLHVEGVSLKGSFGISSVKYPVFAIEKGLRGRVKENVIWHEIGHLIFPSWKHWKIECFAEVMARGGGRGYWSIKYGKTTYDVPSRRYFLRLAILAGRRMKAVKK